MTTPSAEQCSAWYFSVATLNVIRSGTRSMCQTKAHTRPFNGPFSRTTQVSRYRIGRTNLDFTEARDSEWQWHQLGQMQVCTMLQRDNHTSIPLLKVFYRPDALPAAQPTASKHWRQTKPGEHNFLSPKFGAKYTYFKQYWYSNFFVTQSTIGWCLCHNSISLSVIIIDFLVFKSLLYK